MRARWGPTAVAVVASGLTIGLIAANTGAAGGTTGSPAAAARSGPSAERLDKKVSAREAHQITLITGDRVSLLPGPKSWRTAFEPGKGREDVSFRTVGTGDELYVIPSDVAELVATGTLDRRLFDVAGLAAEGYDDKDAKTIPLIVTYRGKAGRSAIESSGADQTRDLPSVNGSAVRVEKKQTAAFLESVAGSRAEARLSSGIEKVWLDGKRQPLLEDSVPQIGAPAAWQAGYTGKGVKVAVLDGGVEAAHPDLAGQVVESKNFSESPTGDADGHGTHVAGTVAGSGAASEGRRKGVAPDAAILDGKVCEDEGYCLESAILAGMQWAAAEKDADVINLSLGGTDTPEIDPLEEAVNTLTEQTGALFVVSAGNGGDWDEPVGSPGSADAALTVGAVDKSDELASFSSRGPRVGDYGVKPDITAPGVDIIAPKSENAWIGEPVDNVYMRLSGTSMAAPHVAGAAALLAQQHPDWEAADLKGALMGSARTHPGQSVFEQGAGRVDAAAATKLSVVATTPSLSFGTAKWPHHDDEPITKTLTYHNTGSTAVTLDLAASLTDPRGDAAPDDAISLSAASITVPAGGEASVEVTSNTNHDGPDGAYSGQVTANGAGGAQLGVPIGLDREVESYDLTLRHLGPDGELTSAGYSSLLGLDDEHFAEIWSEDGVYRTRLPKARYHLHSMIYDDPRLYQVVQPVLMLDKNTTIDIDPRPAKPVTVSVPDPKAVREALTVYGEADVVSVAGRVNFGMSVFSPDAEILTRSVGAGRPDDEFLAGVASQWRTSVAKDGPATYDTFDYQRGSYYTGHRSAPQQEEFATVMSSVHAPGVQTTGEKGFLPVAPGGLGAGGMLLGQQLPATITQYVHGAPKVQWFSYLAVDDLAGQGGVIGFLPTPSTYRAGRTYRDLWNTAALGPDPAGIWAERRSDAIEFSASPFVDSSGHVAQWFVLDTASATLHRNGQLLAESESTQLRAEDIAAEDGDFRLEFSAIRDPALSGPLSTRVDSVWTFRSAAGSGTEPDVLPLWAVRFQPKVDDFNKMKRRPVTTMPIRVESELGDDAAKLRRLVIEVSGDDGKTWRKASVKRTGDGRYLAVFKTPKGQSVSLRASVVDEEGNTGKQTIIAAYLLR